MQMDTRNIRLKIPETTYRALKHLSVDRGITLSELLVDVATRLVEAPCNQPPELAVND
jgi:hypothetical protein